MVHLTWELPVTGGKWAVCIVQEMTPPDIEWKQVDKVYTNEIVITGLPTGKPLSFRVIASNKAGDGPPSNTFSVML